MDGIIVFSAALALSAFCILHTAKIVANDRRERRRREDIEKTSKELENEILTGGNAHRIAALRERLRKLRDE